MSRYQGLAAELYDDFWNQEELDDTAFFLELADSTDGAVLDAGCGSGRILLPLAHAGHEVTGIDSSPAMIKRCRENVAAAGLEARLEEQSMEELDLNASFASIFVPGASFQLLTDRSHACRALEKFHAHLAPGGQLVLATFIPWETILDERQDGRWRLHREITREDGSTAFCHTISEADRHEQLLHTWHRYEIFNEEGELAHAEMHELELRWYGIHEMTILLEQQGFAEITTHGDFLHEPAADGHTAIAFRAVKKS